MVRHVERLGAELYGLFFAEPEHSREAHVDIDTSWPHDVACTEIPI